MIMKKIITILIIAVATIESANSQWQQVLPGGIVNCIYTVDNTVFSNRDQDSAINLSYDNGNNWSKITAGLQTQVRLISMTVKDNIAFIGLYTDTVYKSLDTGHTWFSSWNGLTGDYYNSFAWVNSYLFAGEDHKGVFLTTDTGQSWTAVNNGLSSLYIMSLASSGNSIMVGTYTGGFFLSTDSGAHWRQKNNGLMHLDVLSLATSGNKIFAATSGGMYLSTDTGSTWTLINNGLSIGSLGEVVTNGTITFSGDRSNGVHVSFDDGAHWTSINYNLPSTDVWSMAMSTNSLFIGTNGNGVWRMDFSAINSVKDLNNLVQAVSIFPNPGNGTFNVSVNDLKKNTQMEIINSIGEIIFTTEITQPTTTYDLDYTPGIYFVRIKNTEDQVVKKLVIN